MKEKGIKRLALSPTMWGALVLTLSGLVSRVIGFFYRIFLSNTIGAEGMGLYSLIMPVFSVCFSLCGGAYQTTISAFVAAKRKDVSRKHICVTCTGLAVGSACVIAAVLFMFADEIALYILNERQCASLIRLLALTLPFSSLHACISGYFYGMMHSGIPAMGQLVEQSARVACVYMIWLKSVQGGHTITAGHAVFGMAAGEAVAVIFLIITLIYGWCKDKRHDAKSQKISGSYRHITKSVLSMSTPLMLNRLLLSLLSGIEAVWIPLRLQTFGLTSADALSIYGVLTGMSMPFILFPSALTNSLAVVLLPDVAECKSAGKNRQICSTVSNNIHICLTLGILFAGIFYFFGEEMGTYIFDQEIAGIYIKNLSLICPFLYLTTTLSSILNGLGKTGTTFVQNCISILVRLGFVYILIPIYGMKAYMWGILASYLLLSLMNIISLWRETTFTFSFWRSILLPTVLFLAAAFAGKLFETLCMHAFMFSPFVSLMLACVVIMLVFFLGVIMMNPSAKEYNV